MATQRHVVIAIGGSSVESHTYPSRYNEQTELFVYWGPNSLLRLV